MKTPEKSQDNGVIKDFNTDEQIKAFENERIMKEEWHNQYIQIEKTKKNKIEIVKKLIIYKQLELW